MSSERDRRAVGRYLPANTPTYVWVADWHRQRITMARLLDISSDGALLESNAVFHANSVLHIGLVGRPNVGWIDARPVWFGNSKQVGLRFDSPGKAEFALAAALAPVVDASAMTVELRLGPDKSTQHPSQAGQGKQGS